MSKIVKQAPTELRFTVCSFTPATFGRLIREATAAGRRGGISDCLRIAKEHVTTPTAYEAMRRLLEECR